MPIPPPILHSTGAKSAVLPLVLFEIIGSVLALVFVAFGIAAFYATHGYLPWPWLWRRPRPSPATVPVMGQHGFYQTIPAGLLDTRLADVAGIEEAKRELAEVIDFLRHPAKYLQLGARIPRGFLLHGPPGTGKTLLAKAVSGEAHTTFFHTSGASFVEKYVGVGAGRIRDLFAAVRKAQAPAIIFIDEIDALARVRGTDHAEHDQTLNQLLVEMDGFQTAAHPHPVIVMAATNRADALDPAILRPGRFDRQIAVTLPDAAGRETILHIHTANKPLAEDVYLPTLAQRTIGFSGADLENLCNEAAIHAAREDRPALTEEDFLYAVDRQIAGLVSHRAVHPDDLRRVAFHETGHSLLSWLNDQVVIHKISVIPHGQALGYMVPVPKEERYIVDVDFLWHRLLAMLGGRAAELVFFGSSSTGAADDFQKATALAKDMIHRFGMTRWGLAAVDQISTESLHEPISKILEQGMATACEWVTRYRAEMERVAVTLLRHEVITWPEIQQLWADIPQGQLPAFPDANAWTYYDVAPSPELAQVVY